MPTGVIYFYQYAIFIGHSSISNSTKFINFSIKFVLGMYHSWQRYVASITNVQFMKEFSIWSYQDCHHQLDENVIIPTELWIFWIRHNMRHETKICLRRLRVTPCKHTKLEFLCSNFLAPLWNQQNKTISRQQRKN